MSDWHALRGPATPQHSRAVLLCADWDFTPPLAVAVYALLANNPGLAADFYIVSDDDALGERLAVPPGIAAPGIYRQHPDWAALAAYPDTKAYHPSVNLPFEAVPALPECVQRVVYLDADTVTVGNIEPLLALDLGEALLGAVVDKLAPERVRAHLAAIGAAPREQMLNGGVLVIDRPTWLAADLSAACKRWLHAHADRYAFPDQDALNAVVGDGWQSLDIRYNYQSPWLCRKLLGPDDLHPGQEPVIYHYNCPVKPWQPWAPEAYRQPFQHYAQRALGRPYEDARMPQNRSVGDQLRFMKRVAPADAAKHWIFVRYAEALRPDRVEPRNHRYTLERHAGRWAEALAAAEATLAAFPDPGLQAYCNAAEIYLAFERFRDARATGREAQQRYGDRSWLDHYVALAEANLGNLAEALAWAEAAQALDPGTPAHGKLAAQLQRDLGRGD